MNVLLVKLVLYCNLVLQQQVLVESLVLLVISKIILQENVNYVVICVKVVKNQHSSVHHVKPAYILLMVLVEHLALLSDILFNKLVLVSIVEYAIQLV